MMWNSCPKEQTPNKLWHFVWFCCFRACAVCIYWRMSILLGNTVLYPLTNKIIILHFLSDQCSTDLRYMYTDIEHGPENKHCSYRIQTFLMAINYSVLDYQLFINAMTVSLHIYNTDFCLFNSDLICKIMLL